MNNALMTGLIDRLVASEKQVASLSLEAVPEGYDAYILSQYAARSSQDILYILREDLRMATTEAALKFFSPNIEIISFPAWDCLPYDRVSPNPEIVAERMSALVKLCTPSKTPRIILTTVNAALQRVPSAKMVSKASYPIAVGDHINLKRLTDFFIANGFSRIGTVMEPGEFAIRGGIIDVFPPGTDRPVRIDLFGNQIEGMRYFDPISQRSDDKLKAIDFIAASEFLMDDDAVSRFRSGYREHFGSVTSQDPLYEAVSEKRKHAGMEHWLPLFHDKMVRLTDLVPNATIFTDHLFTESLEARLDTIADYYESRKAVEGDKHSDYHPLIPTALYLDLEEWNDLLAARTLCQISPFRSGAVGEHILDADGRQGREFSVERKQQDTNIYDQLRKHVVATMQDKRQVILAHFSEGSLARNKTVLADHGISPVQEITDFSEIGSGKGSQPIGLTVLPIERGFEAPDFVVLSEQDILGDRLARPKRAARKGSEFIAEASQLGEGDYVVHVEHGIGKYTGLQTIDISGAPHDCVALHYAGGDKIYLPVENIEMLSRYGGADSAAVLDKLGGSGWQARKAKLKKKVMEMADQLIAIAAARELRKGERLTPPVGAYAEFCAAFPFEETEDQLRAIGDVISDLSSGKPMDRLVCGDVGFGKTEVALRAAFIAALSGKQVAIVTPTTLLARQHYRTFSERFTGLPVNVAQLSRMVTTKEANVTKAGLANGQVDIVVGTHALLGKSVNIKNLGLVIVDEEQHFGVAHKERLKEMRSDLHVLTLTATPIPRTLQLAMTGIRDLSIIATPPVDRLAVRTFVLPFDPVVIREALMREHYRGGQSFFVCPRLNDLDEVGKYLSEKVPEVKFVIAHGQMSAKDLDDVMNAFYDGQYDVLVATNIVESGLDIPRANTLVTYRADMFGLAQLYQIRGRIGRSKTRAYAYLTVPPRKKPTEAAEKRLRVLQSLDTLGAGFTLASHDLDIRGAGNLLGQEQSGHVKEVGFELYQEMLEEAVANAKASDFADGAEAEDKWSPTINIGTSVLIPDKYVADLSLRMELYRRVAALDTREEIDGFAVELVDRFGPMPDEVEHLIKVMTIKQYCRQANIEKIEAGPKGAVLTFRNNDFANPGGLVEFISRQPGSAKLRGDHKLVYTRSWNHAEDRLSGVTVLAENLSRIANA